MAAVHTLMTEQEFLRTHFEGPEPDFRDGELVGRAMPDRNHSKITRRMIIALSDHSRKSGRNIESYPELRVRARSGWFPLVDLAVWAGEPPEERFPSAPPLIAIEVLSQSDAMTEVTSKLSGYQEWGVPHIWLIDPEERTFYRRDGKGLATVEQFEAPEIGFVIRPEDLFT